MFLGAHADRVSNRGPQMDEPMLKRPDEPATLSDVLRMLPEGQSLAFSELSERLGSRVHGLALLLLSIPDAIPLPIPSVSLFLSLPMAAISLDLAIRGESGDIPDWLGRRRVPDAVIALLRTRLAGALARGERLSRQRWSTVAGRERLVGLVCLILSLILLLPIPFFNTPPAIAMALLSWGIIRRDGAFVFVGLMAAATVVLLLVAILVGSFEIVTGVFAL